MQYHAEAICDGHQRKVLPRLEIQSFLSTESTSLLISEFSSENLVSGVFRPSCIGMAERNVKAASTSEDNGDHDNAHHWISLRISRNEKEECC
jgi:hypothetical protein